jgi:proton-translocating NADH-quinone oxidoreductase chain N
MSLAETNPQLMNPDVMNMIVLTVVLPLLAAFLLPVVNRISGTLARYLGPLVLIFGLLQTYNVWCEMTQPYMIAIGGFMPPSGIVFYIDQLSLLFTALVLLMTLLLWPYQKQASIRECSLTLLLAAAACGLALSGDLFNIYVFYELASVASFGLVAAMATGAAYAAAIRYLIISGFGSVLALTGIALVYTQTGTLNLAQLAQLAPEQLNNITGVAAFLLILLGIGVKAELFPVNTWVPDVYATAKKRVTALLAGLVSKLAVLVLVRLLVLVFQSDQALQIMLLLGVLGVISGELAAWRSKDMSRLLAYSSIGQLGIVFIAFSIPGEAGLYAGIAISLHHLLVKPALFLLAESWGKSLKGLRGAAKASPVGAILFVLFVLSLIGVPPLPGFWAKLLVVMGLVSQDMFMYSLALAVILFTTVIEANYFFRVVINLYAKTETDENTEDKLKQTTVSSPDDQSHGRLNIATSTLFGAALIAAVFFIIPLGQNLKGIASQAADVKTYISTVFPGTVLPGSEK